MKFNAKKMLLRYCRYGRNMLVCVLALLLSGFSGSEVDSNIEALFIYQFTKYIEWPAEKRNGNFIISVYGDSPVQQKLKAIAAEKKVKDQPIKLQKVGADDDLSNCHILFLPSKFSYDMPIILNKIGKAPVLIVTEKKGLARQGAAINFIIIDDKIRFETNKNNIENKGLKVAGDLLRLSIRVD